MAWTKHRENDRVIAYVSDWYCSDGDSAMLYIEKDEGGFELRCFSGIPASSIYVDQVDFEVFQYKIQPDGITKVGFNERCFLIADYLCSLFCNKINS